MMAELYTGIIAACLPGLKSEIYDLLKKVGFDLNSMVHPSLKDSDDLPDFDIFVDSSMPLEEGSVKTESR